MTSTAALADELGVDRRDVEYVLLLLLVDLDDPTDPLLDVSWSAVPDEAALAVRAILDPDGVRVARCRSLWVSVSRSTTAFRSTRSRQT